MLNKFNFFITMDVVCNYSDNKLVLVLNFILIPVSAPEPVFTYTYE